MTVKNLIELLELSPLNVEDENATVSSAYCGDLLSDVMAHARPESAWFTVQTHLNVIAVATLRDISCIVVVNGEAPDPQTIAKARSQGVTLCGSQEETAALCMKLAGKL